METRKIFCIGFSKTGTTSLNRALNILGIKSTHDFFATKRVLDSNLKTNRRLLEGYEDYEAYCELIAGHYGRLDRDYPNSLFICTYRAPDAIALSCIKHYYTRPAPNIKFWLNYKRVFNLALWHYTKLFGYFFNKQDRFLIFNICAGETWDKLCPFVNKPIPQEAFPWDNKNTI